MADQELHYTCPEIKADSEANGLTDATNTCPPFLKWKLAHEKFLLFFFLTQSLGGTGYILVRVVNWTGAYTPMGIPSPCLRHVRCGGWQAFFLTQCTQKLMILTLWWFQPHRSCSSTIPSALWQWWILTCTCQVPLVCSTQPVKIHTQMHTHTHTHTYTSIHNYFNNTKSVIVIRFVSCLSTLLGYSM